MRNTVIVLLSAAAAALLCAGLALPAAASPASPGASDPPVGVAYTGNSALIRVAHPVNAPHTRLPHVTSTTRHIRNSTLVQSPNWSGYAVKACSTCAERYVDASFNVPSLNCTGVTTTNPTYASYWDGLDGFADSTVEQTGVLAICNGTTPQFYSWYEMYPNPPVYFSITGFGPGDAVDVNVYWNAAISEYQLVFNDITQGVGFSTLQPCPTGSVCKNTSTEVIAEAPSSSAGVLPLADYGSTFFSQAKITLRNGNHYNLENDPLGTSYAIQMMNGSHTLATVSTLLDGFSGTLPVSDFSDTWHASS